MGSAAILAPDPISDTQTFMSLEFLDAIGGAIGSPIALDLNTVQTNDNVWRQFSLAGVAPVGRGQRPYLGRGYSTWGTLASIRSPRCSTISA